MTKKKSRIKEISGKKKYDKVEDPTNEHTIRDLRKKKQNVWVLFSDWVSMSNSLFFDSHHIKTRKKQDPEQHIITQKRCLLKQI